MFLGEVESVANDGTVQPAIATDESLTSGLIQRGGGNGRSRAPAVHRLFLPPALLFLPV